MNVHSLFTLYSKTSRILKSEKGEQPSRWEPWTDVRRFISGGTYVQISGRFKLPLIARQHALSNGYEDAAQAESEYS